MAQAETALRRMRVVTKSIGLVQQLDGLRAENVELKLKAPVPVVPSCGLRHRAQHLPPLQQLETIDAAPADRKAAEPSQDPGGIPLRSPAEFAPAPETDINALPSLTVAPPLQAAPDSSAVAALAAVQMANEASQHSAVAAQRTAATAYRPEPPALARDTATTLPAAAVPIASASGDAPPAAGAAVTAPELEVLMLRAEVREKDGRLRAAAAALAERDEALWVQRQQLEVRWPADRFTRAETGRNYACSQPVIIRQAV